MANDTDKESEFFNVLLDENESRGLLLKETGNKYFKQSDFPKAIDAYNQSIGLLSTSSLVKTNPDVKDGLMASYTNLALVQIKQKNYKDAIETTKSALKVDPSSIKAYYRRGQAYSYMKQYSEAIKDFELIQQCEPSNKEAQNALNIAKEDLKMKQTKEKGGVFSKLFTNGLYDEEIKNTKPVKNKDDPWSQMQTTAKMHDQMEKDYPGVEINRRGMTVLPMHQKSKTIHKITPKANKGEKDKIWILKTWIDESSPQIWRNLAVSETTTLKSLAGFLRNIFGCQGARNDDFTIRNKKYAMSDHDFEMQFEEIKGIGSGDVLDIHVFNDNSIDEGDLYSEYLKEMEDDGQNPGNPMGLGQPIKGKGGMESYWRKQTPKLNAQCSGERYVRADCPSSTSTRLYECDIKPSHIFKYHPSTKFGFDFKIKLEKICTLEEEVLQPLCYAGARASPPEKIGNIESYQDELKVLAKGPKHKDYTQLFKDLWAERTNMPDGSYDPQKFSAEGWNVIWGTRKSLDQFNSKFNELKTVSG